MLFSGDSQCRSHAVSGKQDEGSNDHGKHEQRNRHCRPAHSGALFLQRLEIFRQLRIANLIAMKIHHRDAHAMFHFAGTKIVQERSPLLVFFQIFGDMLGKEDVSCVAAIHHPFCHVDSSAREIGPFIYIDHAANWPAVDSHPKL